MIYAIGVAHHETAIRENEPVYLEKQCSLRLALWDLSPHEAANTSERDHCSQSESCARWSLAGRGGHAMSARKQQIHTKVEVVQKEADACRTTKLSALHGRGVGVCESELIPNARLSSEISLPIAALARLTVPTSHHPRPDHVIPPSVP